jgi:hypothetical protein
MAEIEVTAYFHLINIEKDVLNMNNLIIDQ